MENINQPDDEKNEQMMGQQDNEQAERDDLTPEEDQQVNEAMQIADVVIHGDGKTGDDIAKLVLESQDVATGIGTAIATVILIVSKQMDLADDLLMTLGTYLLVEISDLAINAGAMSEDELTKDFIDTVVSKAYSSYLTAKEGMGELDKDQLAQSVAEANRQGDALGIKPKQPEVDNPQPEKPMNQAQGLLSRVSQGGM
ncbi:hypothetical protein [Shewanella sp. T24-MNA-CIBAN-0130]|uniref:hypothetical protein n=1 Tax=Shewanella sp. T24-MNA-CIBAN-0130 TaxID=3140470 RepID=UPI0033272700